MKKGFLNKNKVFGINLLYIVSLLPLIFYGFYKNGIVMSKQGYMSYFKGTQYLIIPFVIIALSYVFEIYYYLGIKKDQDNTNVLNTIVPYVNTLCYLVCGPMNPLYITIPIIIVLDILLKFVLDKININQVALFEIILFGILSIMGKFTNANLYEASRNIAWSASDCFLGKAIGSIGTTSVLCALIGYVILLFNKYYKKDIPLFCILGYVVAGMIMYLIGGIKFNTLLINTFSSGFVFLAVYVASISNATPVMRGGRIVYGILFGVISAVLVNVTTFYTGMYIVLLVFSILSFVFDKLKFSLN